MNIIDLRKKCRRTTERRVEDRRVNPYEFGSAEWIANMKKDYVAWPKIDRRKKTRRHEERRGYQRRHMVLRNQDFSKKRSMVSILSKEEKELFIDIFKDDL